jgi:hypothetical protein
MYYRYRVKKKDRHIFRNLFILVLLGALGYAIYTYHDYLFFWKYNDNKLQTSIKQAQSIPDRQQRRKALEALSPVIEDYRNGNPLKAEAFFLSALLSYDLGCSYLPGTFSELVVNDSLSSIPEAARNEFFRTIRYVKKGLALKGGEVDVRDFHLPIRAI